MAILSFSGIIFSCVWSQSRIKGEWRAKRENMMTASQELGCCSRYCSQALIMDFQLSLFYDITDKLSQ